MIASQYKNIIQWTLCNELSGEDKSALHSARKIFNNLGVAFPCGELKNAVRVLKSKSYMGWKPCNMENIQKYADVGIPSIGVNSQQIIFILPDEKICNYAFDKALENTTFNNAKHISAVTEEERRDMQFFVYSYGYVIE